MSVSLDMLLFMYFAQSYVWNDNGLLACYRLTHVCVACHHHHHCQLSSSHHHSYVLMRFPTMTTTNFYHDDDKSISAPADWRDYLPPPQLTIPGPSSSTYDTPLRSTTQQQQPQYFIFRKETTYLLKNKDLTRISFSMVTAFSIFHHLTPKKLHCVHLSLKMLCRAVK